MTDLVDTLRRFLSERQVRYAVQQLVGAGEAERRDGAIALREETSKPRANVIVTTDPRTLVTSRGPVRIDEPRPTIPLRFDPAARRVVDWYGKTVKPVRGAAEQQALEVVDALIRQGHTHEALTAAADHYRRENPEVRFRIQCAEFFAKHWQFYRPQAPTPVQHAPEFLKLAEALKKK